MTYREEIQKMITELQDIYDRANRLRDHATLEEKDHFNRVREVLPHAWSPLQKIDDALSDKRAKEAV